MKIVARDAKQLNDIEWAALEALGDVVRYDGTAPEDVRERAAGAEILTDSETDSGQAEITADGLVMPPYAIVILGEAE